MNSYIVRVAVLLLFFFSLLGAFGGAMYYLYYRATHGESHLGSELTSSVRSFFGKDKVDYNFPIPAVAGVTTNAEYQYTKFNIPVDYNLYRLEGSASRPVDSNLDLGKVEKIAIPVLGYDSDFKYFTGSVVDNELLLSCRQSCPDYSQVVVGDIVILEDDNGKHYTKVASINRGHDKDSNIVISLVLF